MDYLTTVLSQEAVRVHPFTAGSTVFPVRRLQCTAYADTGTEESAGAVPIHPRPKAAHLCGDGQIDGRRNRKILQCLEEFDLQNDTLVMFLSDNGGPEKSNGSCNDPLRGQKGDVYEGGIRVPFVACWPGMLPAGTTYRHPVNSIDLACTASGRRRWSSGWRAVGGQESDSSLVRRSLSRRTTHCSGEKRMAGNGLCGPVIGNSCSLPTVLQTLRADR